MTFDLKAALGPVWAGQSYYAKRPCTPEARAAYEQNKVDPDGRVRDMRSMEEVTRWRNERLDIIAWLPESSPVPYDTPVKVYDLGCGDGKLKLARPDLRIYGYDPIPELQRMALSRGCVCVWEDTPERMTVPAPCENTDETPIVDALWSCNAIEHTEDPWASLESALTLVRSGGMVIVETPDFGSPVAMEWGSRYRMLQDPTHISLFTAEGLVRMLRDLGVEVQEVAWPGYFGTPLQERRGELHRRNEIGPRWEGNDPSPPAPGNVVAVRGRKL